MFILSILLIQKSDLQGRKCWKFVEVGSTKLAIFTVVAVKTFNFNEFLLSKYEKLFHHHSFAKTFALPCSFRRNPKKS